MIILRCMKKSHKIVFIAVLLSLSILSLIINNIEMNFLPHGPDEQTYIGAANRIAVFNNKELTIFFPQADNFIPFLFGKAALLIGVDTQILFRIFNIFINFATILLFYFVGRLISKRVSFILPTLAAFTISTTYWLGPAYMVPSSIILVAIPLISIYLIRSQYVHIVAVFIVIGLLYWWLFFPLLLFTAFYYLLTRNRPLINISSFALTLIICFHFIFKSYIQKVLTSNGEYPDWYLDSLITYIFPFVLISVVWPVIIIFKKITKKGDSFARYKKATIIASSLVLTNIVLWVALGDQTQARTFYLLLFGLYFIVAITFDVLLSFYRSSRVLILQSLLVFLIFYVMVFTVSNNKKDVFREEQLTNNEYDAIRWLQQHTTKESAILSDWGSIQLFSYYIDNKNYSFISADSLDYGRISKIISQGILSTSDRGYIQDIAKKNKLANIYLYISVRTCYWVGYSKKRLLLSRELPSWYTVCSSPKMQDFTAPLLYSNGDVYIYKLM